MNIIGQYARVTYHYVNEVVTSDIFIGSEGIYDLKIDSNFFQRLEKGEIDGEVFCPMAHYIKMKMEMTAPLRPSFIWSIAYKN